MKKMCSSCPFNYTEQSEYAQNTGCLPSKKDILQLKDDKNENWACHSYNKRICVGLSQHRNTNTGPLHLQPCSNSDFISWDEKDMQPILLPNPNFHK